MQASTHTTSSSPSRLAEVIDNKSVGDAGLGAYGQSTNSAQLIVHHLFCGSVAGGNRNLSV